MSNSSSNWIGMVNFTYDFLKRFSYFTFFLKWCKNQGNKVLVDLNRSNPLTVIWDTLVGQKIQTLKIRKQPNTQIKRIWKLGLSFFLRWLSTISAFRLFLTFSLKVTSRVRWLSPVTVVTDGAWGWRIAWGRVSCCLSLCDDQDECRL